MTGWQVAIRSLFHYRKSNLAIALGVAAATAVLTGALLVGDSMRGSLRDLVLDRLGRVDEVLVSEGFFRQQLAGEIAASGSFGENYSLAVPVIMFPNGTVECRGADEVLQRASNINVIGITPEFQQLGDVEFPEPFLVGDKSVVINRALADELGLDRSDNSLDDQVISLRIPRPVSLPSDSSLGKTKDLVESIVRLKIAAVIPNRSLGRFALTPSQTDSPNIFVPIGMLQDALSRSALKHKQDPAQANAILIAGSQTRPPESQVSDALKQSVRPSLEDCGLILKRVSQTAGLADEDERLFDSWSISSDRLVISGEIATAIRKTFPDARPVFTYLANDIRTKGDSSGVPFSMVTSIDFDDDYHLTDADDNPIAPLQNGEIVLNRWTADDLGAAVGDTIEVEFYEPETTHGNQVTALSEFKLVAIAGLTEPATPFRIRRGEIRYPTFDQPPTLANDPDLTPEVPGVTDAESIENWDLPFQTADRIRPQDDDYWNKHRTTPKAFVTLSDGRDLWHSRFGETTTFRIPVVDGSGVERTRQQIESKLLEHFSSTSTQPGFHLVRAKQQALTASSGSTPFDVLFLALSMFVIASALALVSLLFRLVLQTRASEVGVMRASGIGGKKILSIWLQEMLFVCGVGAVLGVLLGIGYAALMILGLRTWWVGAISNPFIRLHTAPLTLIIGLASGILVCLATIWWSLRSSRKLPVRGLLSGQIESTAPHRKTETGKAGGWSAWLAPLLVLIALGLSVMATGLSGDAQAGAFMGSGFLVLAAVLILIYRWLSHSSSDRAGELKKFPGLGRLAFENTRRNPLRSTLTISLIAVASFLIIAVSSFRLTPTESGTAGFDFIATSSQSVFGDLNTADGRERALGKGKQLPVGTEVFSLRLKPGQDASCNNLYQSTQPRVLGVPSGFVSRFDDPDQTPFAWAATGATTEEQRANPWRLLQQPQDDDAIPVIIDKNTANYSLKIFATGGIYEVQYDSGESVRFRVVGFLSNTILQGSLLISEENFRNTFPLVGGNRYFLIESGADVGTEAVQILEKELGDEGFDARSAETTLAGFMSVQNTYLSTFQSLGLLGLLLGTFGLGAVQMHSIMERIRELGLMRAFGFSRSRLAQMILLENIWLLVGGLSAGILAAMFATIPHYFAGSASVPWLQLALMFSLVIVVGLLAGWFTSRLVSRIPLLDSLR